MTHKNQIWKSLKMTKKIRAITYVFKQNGKVKAHGYEPKL